MKRMGKTIEQLRKQQGWSQSTLAEMIGCTKQTISNYERDIRRPDYETLEAISDIFNVPMSLFMTKKEQEDSLQQIYSTYSLKTEAKNIIPLSPVTRVPVLGTIAAGEPITANQEYDEYIEVPADCSCADAAVRVQGDSMFPHYHNGDYVFIRFQPDVEDGEIAAVVIDDTAALKRLYHIKGGALLQSENPAYKPMTFTAENSNSCRIIGKAVGFLRWE